MQIHQVQIVAGLVSTFIFVASNLPMPSKAILTRDLHSYSLGQIGLANAGNLLHWLYVTGLPIGPIWFLHGFNTAVSLLMLGLYLWLEKRPGRQSGLKTSSF